MAAGKGKRMESDLPKVLIPFEGKSILERTLNTLDELGGQSVVIVPEQHEAFKAVFKRFESVRFCSQKTQQGTADAIASSYVFFPQAPKPSYASARSLNGEPFDPLNDETLCLLMAGDLPCLTAKVLRHFLSDFSSRGADIAVLGFEPPDPQGFGRLVCSQSGQLQAIVEEKDASEKERELKLCNSGIILVKLTNLFDLLGQVGTKNAQNEYYLTDIIKIAVDNGLEVVATRGQPWQSLSGVNTKEQLQKLEQWSKTMQGGA
jgi:bifunctional UDP-N-acetylglucosamine pyrophosphorylase/glucosamine-1-phosphate N-acetyltransferase